MQDGVARLLRQTQQDTDTDKLRRYLGMRVLPRSDGMKRTIANLLPDLEDLRQASTQETKRQSRSGMSASLTSIEGSHNFGTVYNVYPLKPMWFWALNQNSDPPQFCHYKLTVYLSILDTSHKL